MASGTLQLHESGSSNTIVNKTQVPDTFTTSGSNLLIEWYSGSVLTSVDLFANVTTMRVTDFENATLGNSDYCSVQKPCNHNEGDCDFDSNCLGFNSICVDNGCPTRLGFPISTDCCHDPCNGLVDMESGVLISPNYPNTYQNNLQCTSLITVQQGKFITIEFNSFDVSKKFHIERNKNVALTQYSDKSDQFFCYRLR